jgi:hypothetical protein
LWRHRGSANGRKRRSLVILRRWSKGQLPSVDAPFQARENVGVVVARGRMLSSVRPLMRQEDSRRPVWEFADRVQITQSVLEALWKALALIDGAFICQHHFGAAAALRDIARERITSFYLVPMLYHDLVGHPDFAACDTSSVTKLGFARWSDLIVNETVQDDGTRAREIDVTRFQMLLFTLIAAVFVLLNVLTTYVIPLLSG